MLIKNANVYVNTKRQFEKKDILIVDGKITDMGQLDATDNDAFDAQGCYVVAGLVDVHTHGRAGYDFCGASEGQLHQMARDYARHGVTTVMPTIASAPLGEMVAAAERVCLTDSARWI